jgi:hypothetical protein
LTINSSHALARVDLLGNILIEKFTAPIDGCRMQLWLNAGASARQISFASGIVMALNGADFPGPYCLDANTTFFASFRFDLPRNLWFCETLVGAY